MKRKLYILLSFLLIVVSVRAQDFNPGPDAGNLTERKNVMVDYATGLFHYTVPLYNLKSGDYELPISLDYIGKGVKVNDPQGLLGYNWALNTGGVVTRTMRGGFADEDYKGYLWTESAAIPLEQDARNVGLRRRDGESDIFTAVFNGKRVDFIIRMDESKRIYALPLGQTDVRIECEGTSAEITGWIITDNNGDRYIYRQIEICTDVKCVDVSTTNAISNYDYTSAWYLTRILPYSGVPIEFIYEKKVKYHYYGESMDSIRIVNMGESCKMTYHYGQPLKEQPFDFEKYRSEFEYHIESARHYLKLCSMEMSLDRNDSKLRKFIKYGQTNIDPLLGEYIKADTRIAGMLMDLTGMYNVSKDLQENLKSLAAYCRNQKNGNAKMAASDLNWAAYCIELCLSEIRNVSSKEIWGGSSYKVYSPVLSKIVFPNHIVKFTYPSSFFLPTISLHNRNMELISSVSPVGGVYPMRELAFFDKDGKKISNMQFAYYEKSDFPACKENGKDIWGYPFAECEEVLEEGELENYGMYASLRSLKSIILSDGGKIEIGYGGNWARNKPVGGIRLKSLIFIDEHGERNDTINYSYLTTGISVYNSFSNKVRVTYQTTDDCIEYDRTQPEGHPLINMGNNGFYYPYVAETVLGRGTTTYRYRVIRPTPVDDYPYWLNGLLTEKTVYDTKGKIQQQIRYIYNLYANDKDKLPQMQPSNFYLNGEYLERFYWNQGTPFLSGQDFYKWNIEPRLTPTNTDRFYNLQYGWRVALKEEIEYRYNEEIPYCRTEYCYDNPMSLFPTRIVRAGSDGVEQTQVLKRPMDIATNVDSVFIKMKEVNLLSPIVKFLTLIDGELINETVYRYQSDGESKAGSIVMTEELTYIPDTTEFYVINAIDTSLFAYDETNYTVEATHRYIRNELFRKRVETIGRKEKKNYAYDNFGKLLLECDVIGIAASDKCKGMIIPVDNEVLDDAMRFLKAQYRNFQSVIRDFNEMKDDDDIANFLKSREYFLISSLVDRIVKIDSDLNHVKYYYECIVRYDCSAFHTFKKDYEQILNRYGDSRTWIRFVNAVETLLQFDKRTLFDFLYVIHGEPENVSNGFDYFPKLTPPTGIQNLRLYILDGTDAATGYVTHTSGKTPYTTKSLSSSKLKVYDIDLSMYTDISTVLAYGQGSYMALVPEGANFKATSYNEDGTVYARFDQSGKVEYYTYDAAGRVIQVTDEYGNILKRYEYNKINNQ